jgi:hypothetical protein
MLKSSLFTYKFVMKFTGLVPLPYLKCNVLCLLRFLFQLFLFS